MSDELTKTDYELILESLRFTKQAFEDYKYYPSVEFQRQRVADVEVVISKLLKAKQGRRNEQRSVDPH